MFASSGSTGGGGRGCDAKTIISPNTSFGDIIKTFSTMPQGLNLGQKRKHIKNGCMSMHISQNALWLSFCILIASYLKFNNSLSFG